MASVLVVDDEKSIRNTVSEFLRMDGHEVRRAEDADAAMALMEQQSFDVVVTDIILPRVSGVALLQRIKEQAPDIQVIMMTGEPTVDTAVEAVRAGAYDYLSKPVGRQNLLAVVAQAARLGVRVEKEKIVVTEGVTEICQWLGIDPYASISEGTLIISCRPNKAEEVVKVLTRKGIKSSIVGELTDEKKGMKLVEGGKEKKLEHPIVDPFWRAFYDALQADGKRV